MNLSYLNILLSGIIILLAKSKWSEPRM